MTDTVSPEVRSRTMARVKAADTGPEVALRRALYAVGARGWRCHRPTLPGKPDVAFGRARVAVFVDGAFWHGHPSKYWPGRCSAYWDKKIARNRERDCDVNSQLRTLGWRVIRLWDFEIESDPKSAARRVLRCVRARRRKSGIGSA